MSGGEYVSTGLKSNKAESGQFGFPLIMHRTAHPSYKSAQDVPLRGLLRTSQPGGFVTKLTCGAAEGQKMLDCERPMVEVIKGFFRTLRV